MSTLEICLLGELSVILDGSPITTQIPIKSQALLSYLAATRETHSRHALAGLFWGDRPDDKAKNSLRVAISGLRQKLPDHLDVSRQSLGLKFNQNVTVDLARLESAIPVEMTQTVPTAHVEELAQIPEIYRGDFLTDLALEEAPEFDEWLESQRASWKQLALRGLSQLTVQHLQDEAYDEALKILSHHLEIDPCAEEAHRRAMIAHSRKGDLAAALAQYERCEQALKQILNVAPAPETTAIFSNLKSVKTQPVQAPPMVASKGQLIGRESELQRLRNLLANPFCRLITVAGFGGIGKTELVLAMLKEIVNKKNVQFLHGVTFIPLVSVDSASSIPTAIADTLGTPLSGKRNPIDELLDMLRGKEMLLMLDNFEHLIDGDAAGGLENGIDIVNHILAECPEVKLLITCREWLNVATEWRLGLEGLLYPEGKAASDLEMLLSYPAIEFFLSEVKRSVPDFQLKEDDYEPLCRLCELVGGIPLALMLAATWVRSMSIETISEAVARDLDILTSRVHEMPPRQRSMKVVFDSAWNQLMRHEQEMFCSLSIFRGGFTVEAASNLGNQAERDSEWVLTLDTLDLLASRGLVQYNEEEDRYYLHQLLRQFGRDKLKEDPQVEQLIQQRHSTYYCGLLTQLGSLYKGQQQLDAFQTYKADNKNIVVAWQTAIRNQQVNIVAESADSLGTFFEWRSNLNQAVSIFESAAQMLRPLSAKEATPQSLTTFARILTWLANFHRLSGNASQALDTLEQANTIINDARLTEHNLDAAHAFFALQRGHLKINIDNAQAQKDYNLSLELYRSLGMEWESAVALEALSMVSQSVGDLDAAKTFIEQSLAIRKQIGDTRGTATALSTLSSVVRFQGNIENAIRFARESNHLYQSIDDKLSTAEGLQNLGMTLNHSGKFAEGLEQIERSITIYRSLNNSLGLVKAHANASHVSGCLGQYDRASYHANETVTLAETNNELRWLAQGYTLMAWHAIVGARYEQARNYAEKSLALAKSAGGHAEEDIARSIMGYAHDGLGSPKEARSSFLEVINISLKENDFLPLATAIPKIALMLLEEFEQPDKHYTATQQAEWQQRAVITYSVIKRWPVIGTSKLLETPVSEPIRAKLAGLSPKLVAKAEGMAATMDIWDVVADLARTLPQIGWR